MTREIKFRAWDGKKMCFVDALYQPFGAALKRADIIGAYEEKTRGVSLEDINLMQFTGLKDKNGKEIYEGDVLRDGKGQPGHVLWAHNSWLMEWMVRDYEGKLTYEKMLDDCFGYGEIIGNIYENPELIKP